MTLARLRFVTAKWLYDLARNEESLQPQMHTDETQIKTRPEVMKMPTFMSYSAGGSPAATMRLPYSFGEAGIRQTFAQRSGYRKASISVKICVDLWLNAVARITLAA